MESGTKHVLQSSFHSASPANAPPEALQEARKSLGTHGTADIGWKALADSKWKKYIKRIYLRKHLLMDLGWFLGLPDLLKALGLPREAYPKMFFMHLSLSILGHQAVLK